MQTTPRPSRPNKIITNSNIIKTIQKDIFDPIAFTQKEEILNKTYRFPASKNSA